jgi:hypothetical protein
MNKIELGQGMPDIQLVESDEMVFGYIVVDFEDEYDDEQLMPLAAAGLTLQDMLMDMIRRVERARDIVTNERGVFSSFREHLAHISGSVAEVLRAVTAEQTA